MAKVKLNQAVRTPEGEITTIAELADKQLIVFSKADNFHSRHGKPRTAYFADLKDNTGSWEIGKIAYLSRTNKSVKQHFNQ